MSAPPPAFLALVATATLNLAIGTYVWSRGWQARPNTAFAFLSFVTCSWSLGIALVHHAAPGPVVHGRYAFAIAALIPFAVWAFVESIGPRANPVEWRSFLVVFTAALLFSSLSLSAWVVESITMAPSGLQIVYGPLYSAYGSYILSVCAFAVLMLMRKYFSANALGRIQLGYLLLALTIPMGAALITNLLLPTTLGMHSAGRFGPLFSLLMIAMVGHTIIRHRLMDIRIVVKHGTVYAAAMCGAGALLLGLLIAANSMFPDRHSISLREISLALAVAVLFHPIKNRIQLAFDRYLYREPYDYQRTIRHASRGLASTIELPHLLETVGTVVHKTLRVDGTAIYLFDVDDERIQLAFFQGGAVWPQELAPALPLMEAAMSERGLVFRDELADPETTLDDSELLKSLDAMNADVVAPLVAEGELVGLLAVGPKRSGDSFFSNDAHLLATLADQAAVAFRNAQAHQKVVELSAHLHKILTHIESGVIAVNERRLVTLFNGAAERILGMSAERVRRRPIEHVSISLARLLEATLRDGAPRSQVEVTLPDAFGQGIPFACSTVRLRGSHDAPVGAVAVFTDLSRLKELESERRRAERLASLEAIASGLVHEVRNPLVAVRTFTQLLPARFDDPVFREQFSRVVAREIQRIDDLLVRFRTLAAPGSVPMNLVDVRDPIASTLETLGPVVERQQITVRKIGHNTAHPVLGNVSQLEQLFGNLCLNAVEAMGPGGELTVRIADLPEANGGSVLVEIADTGSGISDDLLESIFDPFVTTKATGTGLGLAICRSIADAHHATLTARNNTERAGATFTLEFPIQAGRSAKVAV
jgi:PAS domain S-box-containing protein